MGGQPHPTVKNLPRDIKENDEVVSQVMDKYAGKIV